MFDVLIPLMIILVSQNVQSKVIIVNTSEGNESTTCCVDGECPCSSLSIALQNMESDTTIIIMSKAIQVESDVMIGSGNLNNITITSSITTITCTDITIYCETCSNIMISGITWIGCGFILSNSSIFNCTLTDIDFLVSGSISIEQSTSNETVNISGNTNSADHVYLFLSDSRFYLFSVLDLSCLLKWNITIANISLIGGSPFSAVPIRFTVCADVFFGMNMVNVNITASIYFGIILELSSTKGPISISLLSSLFIGNAGSALICKLTTLSNDSDVSVLINNTEFVHSRYLTRSPYFAVPAVDLSTTTNGTSTFTLNNVNFSSNSLLYTLSIVPTSRIEVFMTSVNFIANHHFADRHYDKASALYIKTLFSHITLMFDHCNFINNTYFRTRVIYIDEYTINKMINQITLDHCSFLNNMINDAEEIIYISGQSDYDIQISNTIFSHNVADDYIINAEVYAVTTFIYASNFISNNVRYGCVSVPGGVSIPGEESGVYLVLSQSMNNTGNCLSLSQVPYVVVTQSNFTGNIGSCIYLVKSHLFLEQHVLFYNNTADKGAALYIGQSSLVYFRPSIYSIQFLKNSASLGGAIYVDMSLGCAQNGVMLDLTDSSNVLFKDNVARDGYSGDSMYFSISKSCKINTNASDPNSLIYIPYHLNYSQLNSTNYCDISCSHLCNTGFPAITSPHHLVLCSDNIQQLDNVTYFVNSTILGKPAVFKGSVTDYFRKLSEPVQFSLNCVTCPSNVQLSQNYIIIDNTSPVSLTFLGDKININVNVTIIFASYLGINI